MNEKQKPVINGHAVVANTLWVRGDGLVVAIVEIERDDAGNLTNIPIRGYIHLMNPLGSFWWKADGVACAMEERDYNLIRPVTEEDGIFVAFPKIDMSREEA